MPAGVCGCVLLACYVATVLTLHGLAVLQGWLAPVDAGSDVFLRNVDGRTARHVSRGNLAISKLLRKAEDEWLWYRIHQGFADMKETVKPLGDVSAAAEPSPDVTVSSPHSGPIKKRDTEELLETFRVDDDEDDPIEEIAKNIEGPAKKGPSSVAPQGPPDPGRAPAPQLRTASRPKMQRITEKCQDSYFSREELHALQSLNFAKPAGEGTQVFIDSLSKLLEKGPKQRLPYLLSKAWVKELIPEVLDNEKYHHILLSPDLVCNEDFLRLMVSNLPQDRLTVLGKMRNNDQDTLLHILCKGIHAVSPGADILSFLLSACPKDTFDLEARDMRGQTSLHLAAQNGDLGLVQVLLDNKSHPNSQEETTGWTPLHFAVSKAHYSVILQLLQHAETDVNQVDNFEWPPILEACSRLDARATALLVNGRANLAFRSQHQFDVLKAVDTSKKDLAAKRWMSCLVVSNGFRFQESSVQLTTEDRETLHREQAFFNTRSIPATHPPFFVPDHLAPRCHSCKVLFSVTVRRYHCRSCGLVLCGNCFKWRRCMKRGPSGQEPATQVKRQKEMDGASAPSVSTEREHLMLMKVLQPAQAPAQKLSVANVGEFLDAEATRLARERGLEEAMLFMAQGWRRCEEGGTVPSTWDGIAPFQEAVLTASLAQLLAASSEQKVALILALMNGRVPVRLLNELLVAAAEDEAVPAALVSKLAEQLRGRTLNDLRSQQFSQLIHVLRARKDKKDSKYISALVGAPLKEAIWKPPFEPKFVWRGRKKEVIAKQMDGLFLQENTLLGWALSPAALDGALMPPSKAHLTEAGSKEWEGLGRATRGRIEGLQKGLQTKLTSSQDQAAEFVDILLRAGDEPRMAVLEWLGALITAAEPRGRQGQPAPEGFNFWPQYGNHVIDYMQQLDPGSFEKSLKNLLLLQAIHARLQGFPTSGMALNTFTLLLHLIKPIKSEHASTISVFFPLREDVPQLLGNFKKEARFGEKEQVEAASERAKSEPTYTAALSDKTLFKSEIFWLATKGIGSLLMPVAKEAFHAWQGIASVFYDKDRQIADTAWREYLLSEASLKEPRFLERLGHLVDLTFRFLQTAAAGDHQALPPPQPGPTWHVVPSSVLENVIELCDLYRDRDRSKSGGIPTGLFVHLDPDPVLTTLCVVMASEDHVRDPSLRGRAVKLLHRLCMSFRSWRDRLNVPPLDKHLIPCLVNVFIAVEKAIMSYYDLSYRYKYELRVPVMDLFDLALQTEGHRQVLEQFINGEGNDRFLKLLTQLINDSNSQIEEAIRTVKEYHEKQRESAPSASAPQRHDEQVLDDDRTGDGDEAEDIYRRSRMNYKEHAKKYFGLSARTWKQMWLLCKLCAPTIVEGKGTLEQLLHSSLDAQLHYLVGPEMKSIKASPQEYDELGFNPKELIKQIVEIYLFLAKANKAEVVRVVGKDERYYSSNTFSKATNFVRKYGLLSGSDLDAFTDFCKELGEKVSQHRAAFDEAEIPDRYLCEIMADIMSDPVMFPQSRKVADRTSALRIIMSGDKDPFANTPLKVEDLIPQTELKEEIHRFAKDKGIALEGGNMFD
ncbi:Ube4b [Symbiodinium natans]|uniref:Ube4b protein n=1 Tax=Symbiodinium natans TaxID=878477 RepID=A0A812U263_9DINO|nr:Ube4b [Symbiodinium natans]